MYSRSRCQRERRRQRPSKRAAKNVIESRNVSRRDVCVHSREVLV